MGKKKEIDILTPFETQFIDVWFNFNFNGRLAYKHLKSHVADSTADAEASRILGTQKAKDYIELKKEYIRIKEEISLGFIVSGLKEIIFDVKEEQIERDKDGRITSKPDRKSALTAYQQLTKLGGFEAPKKQQIELFNFKLTDLVSFDTEETDEKD